jgi:hypothetical protein
MATFAVGVRFGEPAALHLEARAPASLAQIHLYPASLLATENALDLPALPCKQLAASPGLDDTLY